MAPDGVNVGDGGILDPDALLARAQAETGFSDWGDDTFPERFRLAVGYIQRAGMDEAGQRAGAANCHWLLTSRLKFFEDFKRYPIAKETIERPLFVTGEARGGTTFLQALLSVDPNARSLRFWEIMYPGPPPGLAAPDDPRRARADDDWRDINRRMPKWLISHPYNDMLGNGLPEDERTWNFDFRVMTSTAWWRVPMPMVNYGLPADPKAQYRLHKMMLQYCQYGRPKKHWALKGFHAQRFAALFEAYPDAHVIWVHRDPIQVMGSLATFISELEEMLHGKADRREIANTVLTVWRANFKAHVENPFLDDPRIHHIRYQDLVRDPVETLRGFYLAAGTPFGPENETALRDYLANNRSDRYGKFVYSVDDLGVDIEALHAEMAPYRDRFGLDIEKRR
jgi:hypothetical protein